MNREVKSKKVKGKGVVYTNQCKREFDTQFMVGNPKYCREGKCQFFKRCFLKDGKKLIHCTLNSI